MLIVLVIIAIITIIKIIWCIKKPTKSTIRKFQFSGIIKSQGSMKTNNNNDTSNVKCIIHNNIVHTRYYFRFFASFNWFNSHGNPMMWVIILSLFCRRRRLRCMVNCKSHKNINCYNWSHISKFSPYSYLFISMWYPTMLRWYLMSLLQRYIYTSPVVCWKKHIFII